MSFLCPFLTCATQYATRRRQVNALSSALAGLRRLQDDPETRAIPVVVLSANATSGQIDRLLSAGARDYLTKPLDVKKFLAVLGEALREDEAGHARA